MEKHNLLFYCHSEASAEESHWEILRFTQDDQCLNIIPFSCHSERSFVILSGAKNLVRYYFVYILTNKYNTVLYVGVTNNLERRIFEHKNGLTEGFSKKYKLTKLIYFEQFNNINDALVSEKKIKGWLRKKKIELINFKNPEWKDLAEFV